MNNDLYKQLGATEGAMDKALYLIGSEAKITKQDYETLAATISKIQHHGDKILARAFTMKPGARVKVRGQQIKIIN